MTWQLTWTSEYILENILLQKISHHKLLYSLCQLLCSYLWSTILYDNTTCDSTDRDEGDVGDDDENLMTSEYYYHLLLCLFRQNHFIKVYYSYSYYHLSPLFSPLLLPPALSLPCPPYRFVFNP